MQMQTGIYEPEQRYIGGGATGKVYEMNFMNKKEAEKRIPITMIKSFGRQKQLERQVEILKKIDHPRIVKYLGFQETSTQYRIRMQFCEGQNLRTFLLSNDYRKNILKSNPSKFATKVALSIINALSIIKKSMVTHRDLKLENIMIYSNKDGHYQIKLIDFGESKFTIDEGQTMAGTYGSMAPEIYYRQKYSEQCDCFSLGIILFQIFQGIREQFSEQDRFVSPFGGFRPRNERQIKQFYLQSIFEGINLTRQRTPAPFRKIIRKLLEYEPKNRIPLIQVVSTLESQFSELREYLENPDQEYENLLQSLCHLNEYKCKQQKLKQEIWEVEQIYKELYSPLNNYLQKPIKISQLEQFKILLSIIDQIKKRMFSISKKLQVSIPYITNVVIDKCLNDEQYQKVCNQQYAIKHYLKKTKKDDSSLNYNPSTLKDVFQSKRQFLRFQAILIKYLA